MASGRSYLARNDFRFLPVDTDSAPAADSLFELDESDVWSSTRSNSPEFRLPGMPSSRVGSGKKATSTKRSDSDAGAAASAPEMSSSLPVNIPDWSKILKGDHRENRGRGGFGDEAGNDCTSDGDESDDGGSRVPPHEFLAKQFARSRIASFSVHEGVGRTLKGRDLSRVRNAIWEKTGFQD